MRFFLGLEPMGVANPLVAGAMFHHGKANYYLSEGDVDAAFAGILESLEEFRQQLEGNPDALIQRTRTMLLSWIAKVGTKRLREVDIIAVEKEVSVPVPGLDGYRFTGKIDLISRPKSQHGKGPVIIDETKTAGYSPTLTLDALYYGDQPTAYYWLVEEGLDLKVAYVRPDITYMHRNTNDPTKIQHLSPYEIHRSAAEIDAFKSTIAQIYLEIGQKAQACLDGRPAETVFRRNTHYCVSFGRCCEFSDVCRERTVLEGKLPVGYRRVQHAMKDLDSHTLDEIILE